MAKPDTDDGWLKYAHELDAALAVADFTKGARVVLHEVFEQIFGPPKLKTASISPTELGALIGVAKQAIGRGVRELTDANVLFRCQDGTYRFNKNYETWTHNGSPRLTRGEVRFCRNAPRRAVSRGVNSDPKTVISLVDTSEISTSSIQMTDGVGVINSDDTNVINSVDGLSSKLMTKPSPPKNPLLGRRIRDSLPACEEIPSDTEDAEPFHADSVPPAKPAPAPIGVNSVEDCDRVFAAAEEAFPAQGLGAMCRQWLTDRPARVVVMAIDAARRKPARRPVQFIQALVDDPAFGVASNGPRASPLSKASPALPTHSAPAGSIFRKQHEALMAKQRESETNGS